jgi:hypothetical protein|tara:strand:- start:520 stop:672 length:153 start_codon:yes stop_codon:yes gene_type:complete
MKITEMSIKEITLEIKRAKFWIEESPILKSLELIDKMEKQKLKLIKENLK